MSSLRGSALLLAFVAGWISYAFALFDVGRFSITVLLMTAAALGVLGFRLGALVSPAVLSLLISGLLGVLVSMLAYSETERTFTHLAQYLLAIGVVVGAQTLPWKELLPRLRLIFLGAGAVVLLYALYQLGARARGLPFDFLPMTNLQLGADEGFQRGAMNVSRGAAVFTRVSSFFPEPSDLGRFMMWVFAVGYGSIRSRQSVVLMALGIAGVLVSQSMGSLLGLLLIVSLATTLKGRQRRTLQLLLVGTAVAIVIFVILPQVREALGGRTALVATDFSRYVLDSGRFAGREESQEIFQAAPLLGHGLGSVATVSAGLVVANAVVLCLVERGVLGSILFFGPFLWAMVRLRKARGEDEVRMTALLVLATEVYCFLTFAMLYFPPIYLALGFAIGVAPGGTRPLEERTR